MSKWTISKEFNFEAGHRVWAQKLDHPELSISTECSCRHLHGHSYTIKVSLTSDTLDASSMVTDFKNLNFMKKFVDEVLDHKFILDVRDPNFQLITGVSIPNNFGPPDFTNLNDWIVTIDSQTGLPIVADNVQLHRTSFVLVNFVPTSENICKYLKEHAQKMIGDVATVSALELWETKKSYCRYED